jgi:hypothetical protein
MAVSNAALLDLGVALGQTHASGLIAGVPRPRPKHCADYAAP